MRIRSKEEEIPASSQEEKILSGKNKGFQQISDRNPEPPVGPFGETVQKRIPMTALLEEKEPRCGAQSQITLANKILVGDNGSDGFVDQFEPDNFW